MTVQHSEPIPFTRLLINAEVVYVEGELPRVACCEGAPHGKIGRYTFVAFLCYHIGTWTAEDVQAWCQTSSSLTPPPPTPTAQGQKDSPPNTLTGITVFQMFLSEFKQQRHL